MNVNKYDTSENKKAAEWKMFDFWFVKEKKSYIPYKQNIQNYVFIHVWLLLTKKRIQRKKLAN